MKARAKVVIMVEIQAEVDGLEKYLKVISIGLQGVGERGVQNDS